MEQLRTVPLDIGRRCPHPVVFLLLIVPFGATSGFVNVALAFLATRVGLSVQQGAALIAVSMFPHVWKFFWAPLADKTLSRKRWYLLSALLSAAGIFAMATVPLGPSTLLLMSAIIFVTSVAATFLGFAVEGLVAYLTPPQERGRVSGWFQAGNLGGLGIGGGLGLWLLNTLPSPWISGAILATCLMACAIPLFFIADIPAIRTGGPLVASIEHVAIDLWQVLKSREGILCGVLCFVPVGTGAASGVLAQSEVAAMWHAGAREVALTQGTLTGVTAMLGCLVGGAACSRYFKARAGYAFFGALMALVAVAMAVSPMRVMQYVGYSLAYSLTTGLCYAAFSAFVLDAIAAGHAATKYNAFASLSNAPIWYMGLVLARAETTWGPKGMLYTEAILAAAGIGVFVIVAAATRGSHTAQVGRARLPREISTPDRTEFGC
jgi:MFS family permease